MKRANIYPGNSGNSVILFRSDQRLTLRYKGRNSVYPLPRREAAEVFSKFGFTRIAYHASASPWIGGGAGCSIDGSAYDVVPILQDLPSGQASAPSVPISPFYAAASEIPIRSWPRNYLNCEPRPLSDVCHRKFVVQTRNFLRGRKGETNSPRKVHKVLRSKPQSPTERGTINWGK